MNLPPLHARIFMKAKSSWVLLLTLFHLNIYGQDSNYLRKKAIRIERQDSLSNDFYDRIAKYSLIMVGELHGSNEPAQFVSSLVDLMIKKGNPVQVGLEIPSEEMKNLLSDKKDSSVYSSLFFMSKRNDGRASLAWANLITRFAHMRNVELFYYDVNMENLNNPFNRDSLMYIKVKKQIQKHPDWKTIALGGNIHNMLLPYGGETKMGLYLYNDKDLHFSENVLSVGHFYAKGTIWDNAAGSLTLYPVDHSDSFFAKTLDYENYFFIFPTGAAHKYNAIYFTRKVTPSGLAVRHH
jgi:hypothetical protein